MANNCKQCFNPGVSMRTISPTATPLPTAYDCVAVYIAGRRNQSRRIWLSAEADNQKNICLFLSHQFLILFEWLLREKD